MRYFIALVVAMSLVGCATWKGVKEDASVAKDWTVHKVNEGATYIKEKTD